MAFMKRISSPWTFWIKWVLPAVFFASVAVAFVASLVVPDKLHPTPIFVLLLPLFAGVFAYLIFRRYCFDLADSVWDAGASLFVKKGWIEERIALSNILHVSHSRWVNPQRLTLTLRSPGKLGGEIAFIPPVRVFAFTFQKHPIVDELIERIDKARFGHE
jgi:hypothetical protein